jgi:alkanesulfonate monooxygenase SsuD/methylene tetrahydromethanopterin reductase-like flavin-dependent oxidoreductase (luciferase family)
MLAVKHGINVPNFGTYADIHRLTELAKDAEDNGWDGFFLWDHLNEPPQPMLDPWVALAAIACATRRIRIGTMVTPVARRRPWKLARETVSLDHLSGGRLVLGVGLGGMPHEEHERFGEDPDDRVRARRLDEGLDILAGLWSGEPFTYQGEEYQVDNALFQPRPLQQPRIPVWVAGYWPHRRPFRRAARWDGIVPVSAPSAPGGMPGLLQPEQMQEVLDYTLAHRETSTPLEVAMSAYMPPDPVKARDMARSFASAGATWLLEWQLEPDALSRRIRALSAG